MSSSSLVCICALSAAIACTCARACANSRSIRSGLASASGSGRLSPLGKSARCPLLGTLEPAGKVPVLLDAWLPLVCVPELLAAWLPLVCVPELLAAWLPLVCVPELLEWLGVSRVPTGAGGRRLVLLPTTVSPRSEGSQGWIPG